MICCLTKRFIAANIQQIIHNTKFFYRFYKINAKYTTFFIVYSEKLSIFAGEMTKTRLYFRVIAILFTIHYSLFTASAQDERITAEQALAEMDSPTFVPTVKVGKVLVELPTQEAKEAHMKKVESEIFRTYKPRMKKLTYSQGKLLIKLIDRECHSSSYEMIQAFMGPFRAGFWQTFAWAFGASLKKGYDAEGTDRLTERVVLMVEAGQI